MRAFTEDDCIRLCRLAIEFASSDVQRKYIDEHWLSTRQNWALYARQHNRLLLQVTTTNPVEAWNNRLKSGAAIKDGQTATDGIFGCVNNVHDCAHDVENNIKVAEIESNTKLVTLASDTQICRSFHLLSKR